jgi:periplasmic protein TonB
MKKGFIIIFFLSSFVCFSQVDQIKVKKEDTMVYSVVDEPAEFPGGMTALCQFVSSNIVYPAEYALNSFQGTCFLRFTVTTSGEIKDIIIVKGVPNGPLFNGEAVRVVELMPKWKPAYIKTTPVNSYFNLPVKFKVG